MTAQTFRALSVRQPWATALCHGKDVENRSKPVSYRGPIALHASKSFDTVSTETLLWIANTIGLTPEQAAEQDHRGAVVALAEITGCHEHGDPSVPCDYQGSDICSEWAVPGQWHWEISNVRPLSEPILARGALGLWRLPDDVDARVREALPADTAPVDYPLADDAGLGKTVVEVPS